MNEQNLIKRIRQLEDHLKELEKAEMDDTTRNEIIERNQVLKKYYIRKLKDHKWNWILQGGDIDILLN